MPSPAIPSTEQSEYKTITHMKIFHTCAPIFCNSNLPGVYQNNIPLGVVSVDVGTRVVNCGASTGKGIEIVYVILCPQLGNRCNVTCNDVTVGNIPFSK